MKYEPTPRLSPVVTLELKRLRQFHADALQAQHLYVGLNNNAYDGLNAEEQNAWDILVDYVEENGLEYTEHDPRGPFDENEEN